MPNEYVNHVVINGVTKLDLRGDTISASDLAQGITAHDRSGAPIVGTATGGGTEAGTVTQDANGYLILDDDAPSGRITVESLSVITNGTYTAPTGKAYSPVTVSVSGGGDTWSWMGKNPVKVQEWTETLSFADLGVDEWTYSTTQSTLRAYQSLSPTITCDVSQYAYIAVYKLLVSFDYGNWSPVSAYKKFTWVACNSLTSSYSTANAVYTDTPNTNASNTDMNSAIAVYAGATGTETVSASTPAYAVFSNATPSVTRTGTYTNITATWHKPTIYVRGNSSYFTETAFNNLDMDKSFYDLKIEVWRVDAETDNRGWQIAEAVDIFNNGL